MAKQRDIGAAEFRTRCLRVLDDVSNEGTHYLITKRGKPVARLSPIHEGGRKLRGAWKGSVEIEGDIVHVDWTDEFEAAG